MCLATIDQFLATCSNPRWHRWNNIKLARYIVIGTVIVWILHGIPFVIYYNDTPSSIAGESNCVITNTIFQNYYIFFNTAVLSSILPVTIMIVFGILAYRNIQHIAYRAVPLVRRELDKQLTVMVLVQVFYDVLAVTPLIIQTIYFIVIGNPSNSLIDKKLIFIRNIATILFYFHFVVRISYVKNVVIY